jgi:hypothetical protein
MAQFTADGNYMIRVERDNSVSLVCVHCYETVIRSINNDEIVAAQSRHACKEEPLNAPAK